MSSTSLCSPARPRRGTLPVSRCHSERNVPPTRAIAASDAVAGARAVAAGDDGQHTVGLRADADRRQRTGGMDVLGGVDAQLFRQGIRCQRIEQLAQVVATGRLPQRVDERRLGAVMRAAGARSSSEGGRRDTPTPPPADRRRRRPTRPGRRRSPAAPTPLPARTAPSRRRCAAPRCCSSACRERRRRGRRWRRGRRAAPPATPRRRRASASSRRRRRRAGSGRGRGCDRWSDRLR